MSKDSGTTTQTSQPWSGQQGFLTTGYGDAQKLLDAGGPQYFQGNTYAGQGQGTQDALSGMLAMGNGTPLTQGANSSAASLMNGPGLGAGFSSALTPIAGQLGDMTQRAQQGSGQLASALTPIAGYLGQIGTSNALGNFAGNSIGDLTSTGGAANPQFRSDVANILGGGATQGNPANSSLSMIANGGMMGAQDPYLAAQFAAAAQPITRAFNDSVMPGIQGNAELGGRYGSGVMQNQMDSAYNQLGTTLGTMGAQLYGNAYGQQANNMLGAAGTLGSQYLSGLGLQSQTAATAGGLTGQDVSNRLGATGQITGAMGQDVSNQLGALGQATNVQNDVNAQRNQDFSNQLASLGQATNVQGMVNQQNQQDVQSRLAALGLAPQLNSMNQSNLQMGLGAGQMQDQSRQQQLNADIQRYDYNQNLPQNNLARYMAMITGGQNPGGVTSTTQTAGPLSWLGSAAGLAGGAGALAQGSRGLLWG